MYVCGFMWDVGVDGWGREGERRKERGGNARKVLSLLKKCYYLMIIDEAIRSKNIRGLVLC